MFTKVFVMKRPGHEGRPKKNGPTRIEFFIILIYRVKFLTYLESPSKDNDHTFAPPCKVK